MRPVTRYLCLLLGVVLAASAGSVAAPVPKPEPPKPRVATLKAALGKTHLGKEVRAVMRDLGEYPIFRPSRVRFGGPATAFGGPAWKDDGADDDAFRLMWKTRGVEMAFERDVLKGIFLSNQGADGFDRYPGELPGGLLFGDDPAAIERKLGKPDDVKELPQIRKVGGKPQDELWWYYNDVKGLGVWVVLWRVAEGPYSIRFVSIYEPTKE